MKMWIGKVSLLVLVLSMMLLVVACPKSEDDNPAGPAPDPPYDVKQVDGIVDLPEGVPGDVSDMDVVSFAGQVDVGGDGAFVVDIVDGQDGPMMFFLTNIANAFPVMVGLLEDADGQVEFSVETTVVALSLLNPNLFGTSVAEREAYVAAVRLNPDFQAMVDGLTAVYLEDGLDALDFSMNPEVYQNLAELMKSTMEIMGNVQTVEGMDDAVPPPYLMGDMGGLLHVYNPTFATYGMHVDEISGDFSLIKTVDRRTEAIEFWGWPPYMVQGDQDTQVMLADGSYTVHLTKGPDFANMNDANNPAGLATLYNTSNIVLSIIDLIVGQLPIYPTAEDLASNLNVSDSQAGDIARGISQSDETGVLVSSLDIVMTNSTSLADWMWNGAEVLAADIYLAAASYMMKDIAFTFALLSYDHATGPFVYDLVHSLSPLNYIVTVDGGEVTQVDEDLPPEATFFVNPPAGVIETVFTYDASFTIDDLTAFEDLLFRWDFNGDGIFDTDWSSDFTTTHSYDETGAWDVILEVKDTSDLVGIAGGIVNVGGGAGTATHVKLFRDALPWSSNAMENMLETLGFAPGVGPNTYEILSSADFGTTSITPGEDLVIISNDQPTSFYQGYAANMARFNNFVYMGGSIFWEACDQGWQGGSMYSAGVVLPGNVTYEYAYEYNNYVVNPLLPLVAGLPEVMDHNYASHEAFTNLALGTTIYMEDGRGIPTLIEYSLGGGWVLMTGQPLEHQYDQIYGSPDMEQLLPRIVAYFLGVEPPAAADIVHEPSPSVRSSASSEMK